MAARLAAVLRLIPFIVVVVLVFAEVASMLRRTLLDLADSAS